MRTIVGVLLLIGGIALGIYVGLWLMFIGGIIQVVNAVTADPVSTSGVAWGVVRIVFASFVGYLSAIALILPGVSILSK